MSTKSVIKNLLENDAELTGHLTGGVYALTEINRADEDCAAAFDANLELAPCLNIRVTTTNPIGPIGEFEEDFVSLFYYQYRASGTAAIDAATIRAKELLHNQQLTGMFNVFHIGRNADLEDQALEASLIIDRYRVVRPAST